MKLGVPGKGKDFEVIGIPFAKPGFYVVELASPKLGKALLGRDVNRYVFGRRARHQYGGPFQMGTRRFSGMGHQPRQR